MTQNVSLVPRNDRMAMEYVRKETMDALRSQNAVTADNKDAQSNIAKSQKDPLPVAKSRNK